MKKIPIFVAILLLCLATVEAQDDKTTTSSKADSSEVTTQIATTSDGRKVILKSDGTWEYYKETPPAVTTLKETPPVVTVPNETPPSPAVPKEETLPEVPAPKETPPSATIPKETSPSVAVPKDIEKSTLSFDARVVSKSGDATPIAGGTFYLLNDDLNRILQTSNFKPEKRLSLLNTFSMANYGSSLGIERSSKAFAIAMDSVKSHIVATTASDLNGKGQFSSLVPGTYYLMNVSVVYLNTRSLTDRKAILWNVRVQIQPGQNSIALDQKNAVP